MAKKRYMELRDGRGRMGDREKIRAEKKRKGRKKVFIFFLFVMFIGIALTLSLTVFFMIENITVNRKKKYTQKDITDLIDIQKGENLFRIDTKAAKQSVENALPYVHNVTVKRKLPATLLIEVKESKPAYKIDIDHGHCILLDERSKVLEYCEFSEDYVMLEVVGLNYSGYQVGKTLEEADENKVNTVFDILQILLDNNIENIKFIDIRNESDMRMNYKGNIRILLGDSQKLEEKILFLKGILEKIHDSETGVIDIKNTQKAFFRPGALE